MMARKRRVQACSMPTARMATTICVALRVAKPSHSRAIHHNRFAALGTGSECIGISIVLQGAGREKMRRIDLCLQPEDSPNNDWAEILARMMTLPKITLLAATTLAAAVLLVGQDYSKSTTSSPYTGSGPMKLPPEYREWVYLTSGVCMSYH